MQTYSMVILRDLTQKKCIVWVDHFKVTSETNGSKALAKISCLVDEISGMTYVQLLCKRFRDVVMTPWYFAAAFFDRKKLRYQPMNFSMLVYAGKPRVRKDEKSPTIWPISGWWFQTHPGNLTVCPLKIGNPKRKASSSNHHFFRFFLISGVYFLCSPRKLGKMNPFWRIFFRWVGSTTNQFFNFHLLWRACFSNGLVQPPSGFQLPLWNLRV